jgi:hypothetical protein
MRYRQLQILSYEFHEALRGIALDTRGLLYAAGDSEIKVFDPGGATVRQWTTTLPPYSVAVGPGGSVWVGQIGQIESYDPVGARLRTFKDPSHMGRVTSLGFLKDSFLAGDSAQRCLHRFDLATGRYRNTIAKDNPLGGLHIPNGVVDFGVDAQGAIHVVNPGKHRVERYSADGVLLGHMGKFTGPDPSGFSGCCNPTNVAVAGADLLCVTEKAGPRAKVYNYAGKLLAMIESPDFDPSTKNMDVAVDPLRGLIYVSDPVRRHVVVFEQAAGGGVP